MHALIIEDEFFIALSLEQALEKEGYSSFDIVESEAASVASAQRQCPDLILSDYNLLDGDGVNAIRAICKDRAIPVVFVTASGELVRDQIPHAVVVTKPIQQSLLVAAIQEAHAAPLGPDNLSLR